MVRAAAFLSLFFVAAAAAGAGILGVSSVCAAFRRALRSLPSRRGCSVRARETPKRFAPRLAPLESAARDARPALGGESVEHRSVVNRVQSRHRGERFELRLADGCAEDFVAALAFRDRAGASSVLRAPCIRDRRDLIPNHFRLSAPFRKCTKTAVVEVLVTSWRLLRYLFDSLSSSPPDGLGQALHPPCARHFQTDRFPTISRRR